MVLSGTLSSMDPAIFMESMNFLFLQYLQNHGRGWDDSSDLSFVYFHLII